MKTPVALKKIVLNEKVDPLERIRCVILWTLPVGDKPPRIPYEKAIQLIGLIAQKEWGIDE